MKFILGTLWRGLVNAYDAAFELIIVNLFWVVLSIPIITAPLALAGMFYAASKLANNDYDGWKTFFIGIRKYFGVSLLYAFINITVIFALWFYWNLFGQYAEAWAAGAQVIVLAVLIWWLLLQVYAFPMLMIQDKPSLWIAGRNSLVVYLKWPGLGLVTSLFILLIMVLSSLVTIPWMLFTGSLSAFLASFAIREMLETLKPQEPEEGASNDG